MRRVDRRSSIWMTFVIATIMALCALSASAGVNRWTTHWPKDLGANRLAVDPTSSDVVFAATALGVWKTENGGLSWSDPTNGALKSANVHSLAVNPSAASVYAGTANGILGSTDGGLSWSNRLAANAIYSIVFASPTTAYAADYDDVSYYPGPSTMYSSNDGGATWNQGPTPFTIVPGTLVADPTQPSTLYVGTYYQEGLRKSTDGGLTWSQPIKLQSGVYSLAIDPQKAATLYLGSYGAVFKRS